MHTHIVKTTIEIADDLAIKAKALAVKRATTLRAIIEQGIRATLEAEQELITFELKNMSANGHGLRPEFKDKSWTEIRDAAYEGRGS